MKPDRRVALHVARSLQSQLFFYEVEWGGRVLQDNVEDVYMFLGEESEGSSSGARDLLNQELPTGVVTTLASCYAPTCDDENPCYSWACPRRVSSSSSWLNHPLIARFC
jgi:RHO1 GDP-GTP exchange protein 1/2